MGKKKSPDAGDGDNKDDYNKKVARVITKTRSQRDAERENMAKIYRRKSFSQLKRDADDRRWRATMIGGDGGADAQAARKAMLQTGQVNEAAKNRSMRMLEKRASAEFGDKVNQYIVEGDGRPSALQAELFRRMSHATVLENDWYEYLPMWSSVKRVGEVLGAGVELYFRLLRMMFFCFLFLFVVAYLWIYIANYATFFDKSGSPFALNRPMLFPENGGSTMQLAGASLAAIPVQKDATIREATDSRLEYEIKGSGVYEISHGELLYFIEAMTLLNGLLIYLFIQFTRFRSSRVLRRVDEASIEVSDYTVYVDRLPPVVGAQEVAEWFNERFGKVAEVQLASDDNALFAKLFKRSHLMMELKRARKRVELGTGTRKTVRAIKARVAKLDKSVIHMQKRVKFAVVGAFITFNAVEARNKCLAFLKTDWISRFFRPKKYRFRGTHVINSYEAEPPTNINYHNLQFSGRSQFFRRLVTLLVSFVVLVVSFLVVSEIRFQANKLASTLDWDTSLMVDYVGADEATIRASGEDQQGEPRARFGLTCADAMSDAAVTVLDEAVEGYDLRDYYTSVTFSYGGILAVGLTPEAGQDDAFIKRGERWAVVDALQRSVPLMSTADDPDREEELRLQGIAYGCYCTGLWSSFEESNRVDKQLLSAIETDCDIFVSKDERLSNLAAAGSVAIVVFNFILEVLLKSLARYERHHTVTDMMSSRIVKQAIVQWINTGFIELIASARFSTASNITNGRFGAGFYNDFTQEWYSDVGSSLLRTVLIAALAPFAVRFAIATLAKYKRKRALEKSIIQEDLNIAYVGPQFGLDKEYAHLLMITLTCLMYGAGLPLMFVILALKCLSQYVIDRWMLLRVCRVPPRISDRVTKTVTRLLVFGLFLYLTMAAWMLSFFVTPDIGSVAQRNLSASAPSTPTSFTTEDSDFASNEGSYSADRVIQANVFFIFLAMILMFFYYILVKRFFYPVIVTFAIRGVLGTLMQSLTCCCRKRVALWAKSDQMDFYDAYRDGKILGTPTYAIIDQPEFKAHFEVDVKLHEPDDDLPDNAAAVQAEELKREKKRGMIAALMGRGEASDREDGGDDDDGQDGDEGDVEEDDAEGEEDGEGRETGTKQEPASGWGIGWLFGSR